MRDEDLLPDLTMEAVPERTKAGDTLWRAEVRRPDGYLVDCSELTPNPREAIADGEELLRQHRDDLPDAKPFHDQALQLFAHVA
jgi:hypothetical protein